MCECVKLNELVVESASRTIFTAVIAFIPRENSCIEIYGVMSNKTISLAPSTRRFCSGCELWKQSAFTNNNN